MTELMHHDLGGLGAGSFTATPVPALYARVRKLVAEITAARKLAGEGEAEALVNDAWLRFASTNERTLEGRRHFLAVAAEAVRRHLVECARKQRDRSTAPLNDPGGSTELPLPMPAADLVALNEAREGLADADARAAEIVNLAIFMGLSLPEVALSLDASLRTVQRRWQFARIWIFEELQRRRSRFTAASCPGKDVLGSKVAAS